MNPSPKKMNKVQIMSLLCADSLILDADTDFFLADSFFGHPDSFVLTFKYMNPEPITLHFW